MDDRLLSLKQAALALACVEALTPPQQIGVQSAILASHSYDKVCCF
jgi:hypothetical protein